MNSEEAITTILVGPTQRQFEVPKELLCSKSNYFKHSYHAGLREARENLFRLEDVSERVFRIFLRWLETGELYLDDSEVPPLEPLMGSGSYFCLERNDSSWYEGDRKDFTYVYEEPEEDEDEEEDMGYEVCSDQTVLEDSEMKQLLADLEFPEVERLIQMWKDGGESEDFVSRWETLLDANKAVQDMRGNRRPHERQGPHDPMDLYEPLIDIYIFADRFDVRLLRAKVLAHLQSYQRLQMNKRCGFVVPSDETVAKVYESLMESSGLRRWVVAIYIALAIDSPSQVESRDWKFWREMCSKDPGFSGRPMAVFEPCYFHEHRSVEEVLACRKEVGVTRTLVRNDVIGLY